MAKERPPHETQNSTLKAELIGRILREAFELLMNPEFA